jgi:hypothetical protein
VIQRRWRWGGVDGAFHDPARNAVIEGKKGQIVHLAVLSSLEDLLSMPSFSCSLDRPMERARPDPAGRNLFKSRSGRPADSRGRGRPRHVIPAPRITLVVFADADLNYREIMAD